MAKLRLGTLAVVLVAAFTTEGVLARQVAPSAIRGRILDSLTGQPVPRVRYIVTGANLLDPFTGTSDAQGDLTIADVPAGRYQLTLEKAGYFPLPPAEISVTNASPLNLPNLALTARREISGIVRWQNGEVAARAPVSVMVVRGGKPANPNPSIPAVQTSEQGEFVVPNLRPGRYILLVSPPRFVGGVDNLGRFITGGTPRLGMPVFYPGVTRPDANASLDLRGTLNIRNVAIVFEEKPGTVVEGTVIPSTAAPAGTPVFITLNNPGLFSASTPARSGDAFRIGPVPSGFYVLDAQSQVDGQASRTLLTLTVGGSTLSGIAVSIPPPVGMSGRVEIDDPAVRVNPSLAIQTERIPGILGTTAGPNGDFRIPLAVAGETYGMTLTLPRNSNVYVAAVRQGGQERPLSPFQVIAGNDPVQVVLKTDGGTIDGVVKDEGRIVAQAFVVLAPKDRRLEQHYRTIHAGVDGAYRLPGIAPGDYDLFDFDRNEDDDYLDELFLRNYADKAVEAKVAPRSTRTVELAVQNIPRR
jgi:hypothetical protein